MDEDTRDTLDRQQSAFDVVSPRALPANIPRNGPVNSSILRVTCTCLARLRPPDCCVHSNPNLDATLDRVPIGSPIANTEILCRRRMKPCAVVLTANSSSVARESVVAIESAEVYRREFVPHPFITANVCIARRLGKVLEDGQLEFAGRRDQQIKCAGFAWNWEVEAALTRHPAICEAAVIANDDVDTN